MHRCICQSIEPIYLFSLCLILIDYPPNGNKYCYTAGLPDTFTGEMDFNTSLPADNCYVMAPHQWANQGCVAVNKDEGTIGQPLNEQGGGIYALEWDPDKERAIRSWVFPGHRIGDKSASASAELIAAVRGGGAGCPGATGGRPPPGGSRT